MNVIVFGQDGPFGEAVFRKHDLGAMGHDPADNQGKADYTNFPFAEVRRSLEQFRSIQKYFYGDYYPLTEYTQANDAWMAYQLDLPAEGEGLVVVLKRPESSFTQATFRLHGLASAGAYVVEDLDRRTAKTIPAARLREAGLEVSLMKSHDTALIRYQRKS